MTDKEKIINIEHFIKLKDLIKLIITNLFFSKNTKIIFQECFYRRIKFQK